MLKWMVFVLLLSGCGSGDDGAFTCSKDDRSGTYLLTAQEMDGTCGPQTSALVRLDPDTPLSPNCQLTRPDDISDDWCTLERSAVCAYDALEPGAYIETTMISTQKDESGALITGTMTIGIYYADGTIACFSTYSARAERQ